MKNLCGFTFVSLFLLGLFINIGCNQTDDPAAPERTTTDVNNPSLQKSGFTIDPGVVSWWPGDGNANDIVGGNHGTLQNGATFAPGMVGQSFSFDGVNDYVSVADNVALRAIGEITIDFWARFNTVPRTGDFFDTMTLLEKAGDYIVLWRADGEVVTLDFTDACDGGLLGPYHLGANAELPTLQSGEFHHYAFTAVDGGASGPDLHFFFDGVEQPFSPQNDPPHVGCGWFNGVTGELRLGIRSQANATAPLPFDGLIDEVEIYDRALSASEIQAIFKAGNVGVKPTKLVTICHQPGTPTQKTLVIPFYALAAHLGHGDTIGPCQQNN